LLPLPPLPKQTQRAKAGGEERECGGERTEIHRIAKVRRDNLIEWERNLNRSLSSINQ